MNNLVLKIHWTRRVEQEAPADPGFVPTPDTVQATEMVTLLEDETTLFIPADQVRVHAEIPKGERKRVMKHWHEGPDAPGYLNYLSVFETKHPDVGERHEQRGRLICVIKDGAETWYTASQAWVLGHDGGTIERVAP